MPCQEKSFFTYGASLHMYWCWSWNSNTLATWCKELTHLKRPWCWERLKAGGEGDDRGWDGWMASLTRGHEFEKPLGVVDGQRALVCYSPWGCKESDTTERLNWTEHMEGHFKRNLSKWEDKAPSVQNDVGSGAFDRPGIISFFCTIESGIGVYMEKILP